MRTQYRKFSSTSDMFNYLDIMMTLVFFLILTTNSNDVYRFAAQLPGSQPTPLIGLQTEPQTITIFVSEDRAFYIDSRSSALTIQELEKTLVERFPHSQDQVTVRIGGDKRSVNEDIMAVLSLCSSLGMERIEFLATAP